MVLPGLLQGGESPGADLLDRALPGNLPVAGRARIALLRPFRIIVDQRPGLLLVDFQPLSHRFLTVVLTLDERLPGRVVLARDFRRVVRDVVVAPGPGMHTAPAQTADDLVVVYVDLEHEIQVDSRAAHGLGLGNGARKSVEEIPVL